MKNISLFDRIYGCLLGSSIADAMAGPHEGRSTIESREFLRSGGWINNFNRYSPAHQGHWNVYPRLGKPGLFTDDSRLRFMICQAMIDHQPVNDDIILTQMNLAKTVFNKYWEAHGKFVDLPARETNQIEIDEPVKELFLHMWFMWELVKTATSVTIPQDPPIYSPGFKRKDGAEKWTLIADEKYRIEDNIKSQYHNDSYLRNIEMPLGMIALLPVAIYFPANPTRAFEYVIEIDFFDIGAAPYFAAWLTALLAGNLGGLSWEDRITEIRGSGLVDIYSNQHNESIQRLNDFILPALDISRSYRERKAFDWRKDCILFFDKLYDQFAMGKEEMCTIGEMVAIPTAILDYSRDIDLRNMIELSVNYGRDNDTIASICAALHGARVGWSDLPESWIKIVQEANNETPIKSIAQQLTVLSGSLKYDVRT